MEPRVVTETEMRFCSVELGGEWARGMVVVDRSGFLGQPPNVEIVTNIDKELYEKMLITAAGGPYYE
jgi:inosine-uridine nucleoside N-ribohydrolase